MDSVEYLRKIGLGVPSGQGTPLVLQQRGYTGAAPAAAAAGPSGSGKSGGGDAAAAPFVCQPCKPPMKGYAEEALKRDGHPAWFQPNDGVDVGLRANNSLTGQKELFKPMEKKIRWYTCGPTVYDVSHMGHARAYLTFDILRRVMANYFKYDMKYQINITDIDDKIILRSRQNKLFADFEKEAEGMKMPALQEVVDGALTAFKAKLDGKKPAAPEGKATDKDKQQFDTLTNEHALKVGQFEELKKKVAAAKGDKAGILKAARDPLMGKLDKERGHLVTDHAVFNAHARHFEDEYFEDMDALGVLRPDVCTRISDFMDGRVQDYILKLVNDGFAYESQGSVYFDIDGFNAAGFSYRKLVPAVCCSAADMEEGEGALAADASEKRNPNDFALWKKSKPGEPAWKSVWSEGRPGWHIECSVMANSIMKEYLDIHAGGEDLKFPHHDNEIAQSEAYLGKQQWVNYFWHAGHLSIKGLKMSKSLKNFITIRQALTTHSARQLRLMFLMQQWDKGMNYSDDAINMAKAEERKAKHFAGCLKFFKRHAHSKAASGDRETQLLSALEDCKKNVDAALKDNFNTSKAIELISALIGQCYASYDALPEACLEPVVKVEAWVVEILGIFGVENLVPVPEKEAEWIAGLDAFAGLRDEVRKNKADLAKVKEAVANAKPAVAAASTAGLGDLSKALQKFMTDLDGCTEAKDLLKRCDEVRDEDFVLLGVRLEDRKTDFVWMFDDTKAMQREAQEAQEKKDEAQKEKLQRSLGEKKKALEIAEKNAVRPADLFRKSANASQYTEYDEAGMPTKLADGEVSKSKAKDFKKDMDKQTKEHEKLVKQAGADGIDKYLQKLRDDVEEMEKKLGPR